MLYCHTFVCTLTWVTFSFGVQVLAISSQFYPSEYAYHQTSVSRGEKGSANCMSYRNRREYIHCDGTQLRLTDSDLESEQFHINDYYEWPNTSQDTQLLFIFPTRVNLTTITVHYYSGSKRGLSRLRFYAVQDEFNIWNAPTSTTYVDVTAIPPSRNATGRRSININVTFSTKKVLMYKYSSHFVLAVNEVQFFNCYMSNGGSATGSDVTLSTTANITDFKADSTTVKALGSNHNDSTIKPHSSDSNSPPTIITFNTRNHLSTGSLEATMVTGIILAILLLPATILAIVLVLCLYKRKHAQHKPEGSYSTLYRGSAQQLQPQLVHIPQDVYDQIHLSPSTGQAEYMSKTEAEKVTQHHHENNTSVDTDKPQDLDKGTALDQPTYAVINKKQKMKKESTHCNQNNMICEKEKNSETNQNSVQLRQPSEELYTAVKKSKTGVNKVEAPPIPPRTVEEMYAEVHKRPKGIASEDEEEAPPIPPHTIEELYTAVQKNM